jgi:hypothetical protein
MSTPCFRPSVPNVGRAVWKGSRLRGRPPPLDCLVNDLLSRVSECSRTHYHLQKVATKAKVEPMKTGATAYNKGIEETREVRAILVVQLLYGRQ